MSADIPKQIPEKLPKKTFFTSVTQFLSEVQQPPTAHEFTRARALLSPGGDQGTSLLRMRKSEWMLFVREVLYRLEILDTGEKASALTYTFILSLVPLLAIAFTFFNFFGGLKLFADDTIKPIIRRQFLSDVSAQLEGLIDTFVSNIQTGALGAVAFVTFLITVVSLLYTVEKHLNSVFEVVQDRSMFRRFTNYWIILSLTPLVIVFSLAKSSELLAKLELPPELISSSGELGDFGIVSILRFLVGNFIQVLGFCFLFAVLPNRRSTFSALALGGIVSTFLFNMLAHLNIFLSQLLVSNAPVSQLYGSIPLLAIIFFAWIRYIWQVILFGACLTAAFTKLVRDPNGTDTLLPSPALALTRCADILERIVREFELNNRASSPEILAKDLSLPQSEVWEYFKWLQAAQFVFDADESRLVRLLPTHRGLQAAQSADLFLGEMIGSRQLTAEQKNNIKNHDTLASEVAKHLQLQVVAFQKNKNTDATALPLSTSSQENSRP